MEARKLATWLLCLVLTACGDPISDAVNKKWQPVSPQEQRQTAIDTAAMALRQLQAPNLAARVSLSDLQKALDSQALKKAGVTSLKIEGDDQLLLVSIEFDKQFTESDVEDNPDL